MLGPGLAIVAAENPQPRDAFPYNVRFTGQTPVRGGRGGGAAAAAQPKGGMVAGRDVDPTARAAPNTTPTTATATTGAAIPIIAGPRTPPPHFTTRSVPLL